MVLWVSVLKIYLSHKLSSTVAPFPIQQPIFSFHMTLRAMSDFTMALRYLSITNKKQPQTIILNIIWLGGSSAWKPARFQDRLQRRFSPSTNKRTPRSIGFLVASSGLTGQSLAHACMGNIEGMLGCSKTYIADLDPFWRFFRVQVK